MNYIKKIVSSSATGFLTAIFSLFILEYFHLSLDYEAVRGFFDTYTRLSLLQAMIIFIIFFLVYFLTYSKLLSALFIIIFSTILGIVSNQKMIFRGEPFYPSDIYFLRDLTFFLDMIDWKLWLLLILFLIIMSVSIFLYVKYKKKKKSSLLLRVIGIIITTFMLLYINQFNVPGNKVRAAFNQYTNWISYSQERNYTRNGMVSGILYNLKSPVMGEPGDYNKQIITDIYSKYLDEAENINENRTGSTEDVNIIYIMNETFSDAHRIDGITINGEDTLKNYRNLTESYINGQSLSQAYGGGTANIEFEALTGISLEPLSGNISIPFIHMSNYIERLPSILKYIQSNEHSFTAIHPHNSTMYKRMDNYKSFGFDSILFQSDMENTGKIDNNPYISDEEAYKEVIETMKTTTNKDFVHLVTMQNHLSYSGNYEDIEYRVEGEIDTEEVENYLQGMKYSDIALKDFLATLDDFDEKVLVVFWGDRLPAFYSKDLISHNGHLKMHETPLLFYTNYRSAEGNDIGTISPIYFINHVLELTESEVTPFIALLQKMEIALPAFEKGFYLERETGIKESREELKLSTQLLLRDYDLILYDITTGKDYSKELGFY